MADMLGRNCYFEWIRTTSSGLSHRHPASVQYHPELESDTELSVLQRGKISRGLAVAEKPPASLLTATRRLLPKEFESSPIGVVTIRIGFEWFRVYPSRYLDRAGIWVSPSRFSSNSNIRNLGSVIRVSISPSRVRLALSISIHRRSEHPFSTVNCRGD
jgi:hypothetical protein